MNFLRSATAALYVIYSLTKECLCFVLQHVQVGVEIMKSVTMELASAPHATCVMAQMATVCKVCGFSQINMSYKVSTPPV